MKNSYPKRPPRSIQPVYDDVAETDCCDTDDTVLQLDELNNRLLKANSYAHEIVRRTERLVDRVFAPIRDDEDCKDGEPVHMGMVEMIGYEIGYLMDKLRHIDQELRTLEGL